MTDIQRQNLDETIPKLHTVAHSPDEAAREEAIRAHLPRTMRAARLHAYGGLSALSIEDEVPIELPGADEVLVQVQAAGINPLDWKLREGLLQELYPLNFPTGLGSDFTGTVVAVGGSVTGFKPGDRVYGMADMARGGAFAEYAIAKVGAIAHRPRLLTSVQSASVPVVAMTAWEAIHEVGHVKPSSKVLVHGATGMVGRYAIQFLRRLNCHVVALTNHQHAHLARELGADTVFDYERAPFEEYISGIEFALDTIGGEIQARTWQTLLPGATLVALTGPPDQQEAARHGVRAEMFQLHPSALLLADIARLLDAGEILTFVGKIYSFNQVAQALEAQKEHKVDGKIVLEMA